IDVAYRVDQAEQGRSYASNSAIIDSSHLTTNI
ncbi:unnamed protein product, partial [marine sediment metagenome]